MKLTCESRFPRCALLFGTISEKENGMKKPSYCIRVEAIFEPPRVSKKENGVCRDLYGVEDLVKGRHLEEAKRISTRLGLQVSSTRVLPSQWH